LFGLEADRFTCKQRFSFDALPNDLACGGIVGFPFEPSLYDTFCFRKVIVRNFSTLVAKVEAVGGDFEEEYFFGLPREFFVEQEDAGLSSRRSRV